MNNSEIAVINFKEFQKAMSKNRIKTERGKIHPKLKIHMDQPEGEIRITYASMATGTRIKSSCVVVSTDPYKDKPCFDVGITTLEKFQGKGFAKEVLMQSLDELKQGLARNGITEFYIELKVDSDNVASHNLCKKVADETMRL